MSNDFNTLEIVEGAALLVEALGAWPSFHDAEVDTVVLDRAGEDGPSLELLIRVGSDSVTIGAGGYLVPDRRAVVVLRFGDIDGLDLLGFSHQNVIFDLSLTKLDPGSANGRTIRVEVPTSTTCELKFNCRTCRVVSVE